MRRQRGNILILAILILAITSLLAYAFLSLAPGEYLGARKYATDVQAALAADAGIRDGLVYIEGEAQAGRPLTGSWTVDLDDNWSYRVRLEQFPFDPETYFDFCEITSTALRRGHEVWRVRCMAGQESYTRLAWLLDRVAPNIGWPVNLSLVEGPVHFNDPLRLFRVTPGYYGSDSPAPFRGSVSSASFAVEPGAAAHGDGVVYWEWSPPTYTVSVVPPYQADGTPIEARYRSLYRGGRESVTTGAEPVELPADFTRIQTMAWGGGAFPVAADVYVPNSGGAVTAGVYVTGIVDQVTLSVDLAGRSIMEVDRSLSVAGDEIRVIEDVAADTTTVEGPAGAVTYNGLPNGAVFFDESIGHNPGGAGWIGGLAGTNTGRRTICAEAALVVRGDILQNGTAPGDAPTDADDALGLVSRRVVLSSAHPRNDPTDPLYLYAAVLAGRAGDGPGFGFMVDSPTVGSAGRLELHGALTAAYEGITHFVVGESVQVYWYWSPWSGWRWVNRTVPETVGGFARTIHHDQELAYKPPPFFPRTTTFRVHTWEETRL